MSNGMMAADCTVQVALRIRPLIASEIERGCKSIVQVIEPLSQVQILEKAFTYNYVFDADVPQEIVYQKAVEHKVAELFKGYNVTILAYGQTGSGKTHSMGTTYKGDGEMGVIPRALHEIFNTCKENFLYDFVITVSFVEIYQEVLYDLLSEKPRDQCVLEIREDNKGILLPGVTEKEVGSVAESLKYLAKGSHSRATGCTNMNSQSSRSHAIFTVNISMQHKQQPNLNRTAKFHLVDLAGSERSKKTGATGQTFREGININKGLFILGNVISALGDEKQRHSHIPYRDSNLTRLLKDSLGGNSITLMIACISPADYNLEESISTLQYADKVKRIKNKPVVNQDPKSAEINRLNKLVQQLRLELMGQGGPIISQGELEALRTQNEHLKVKNIDLTTKLSSTLNENTALLEKVLLMQAANEKLVEKLHSLKDEYNVTLSNLNVSLENNDMTSIRETVTKLEDTIQKCFLEIDEEHKRNETELRNHDANQPSTSRSRNAVDSTMEVDIIEKQETHTAQQVALSSELQDLMRNLAMKESLAQQIAANTNYMVDYKAMAEHEDKIATLEKEKEHLVQALKNTNVAGTNSKLAEQRRKQVQELESQIQSLKKKVQEQARLIKLKEKDELKIKQLNNEIMQMKQTKVKLIKNMRQESEKFRTWKTQRERELHKLKDHDRKMQNQIVKMETMHNRQQNVLKRKMEEVAAVNKRLKDALAVRKAAQENRKAGKTEKVGQWIQHELEVYLSIVEAQATLTFLLEDRASQQEHMDQLKSSGDAENINSQIIQIQEEIDMISAQITDLQQKIMDFDEENRSKSRFDNIQTMGEAKSALKALFDLAAEHKKKETSSQSTFATLRADNNELKKRIEMLENEQKNIEIRHKEELAEVHKEVEEKVTLLLHQLRGMDVKDADKAVEQRCIMLQHINEKLELQVTELQERLSKVCEVAERGTLPIQEQTNVPHIEVHDVEEEKTPLKQHLIGSPEVLDVTVEGDDTEKDPDWRCTPLAKRIMKNKTLLKVEPTKKKASKRSSDGGCTCKGTCSKRNCSCKRLTKTCNLSCKCSEENCANRIQLEATNVEDNSEASGTANETGSSSMNVEDSSRTPLQEVFRHPQVTKRKKFFNA